jgi:putative transposase
MKSRINRRGALRAVKRQQHKHARMEQRPLGVAGVLIDVQHAFQGLCLRAGLAVMQQLMEEDRTELCGPKGVPDAARRAVRGGTTPTSIVFGGQRLAIERPRVRHLEYGELALPSYEWAADTDPLNAATLSAIAAGVSTRRYGSTQPQVPEELQAAAGPATSKSAVSRRFVSLSAQQVLQWLKASIAELDIPVVMIDGIYLGDSVILVALGIDAHGNKHVLGLHEGSTENARVVKALLRQLIDRGLHADRARLWVIDGGKALRSAIFETFGKLALVQRCQEHKRRNVLEHLPEAKQRGTSRAMRDAWDGASEKTALRRLHNLASVLDSDHPGAAASLREGLAETLTLQRLGITGALYRTLRTTNPIENLNGSIARYSRNVQRWKDGTMVLRWVASALHDAQRQFRRLRGCHDMNTLLVALNKHAAALHKEDPAAQIKDAA